MHHNLKSCDYTYFFTIISKAKWPFSSQSDNVVFIEKSGLKVARGLGEKYVVHPDLQLKFAATLEKKTKQSEKNNPHATRAIKGSTSLISKVSKSHLEKKPCDAPSTANGLSKLLGKAASPSPWTYLRKIFPLRITA